MHNNQITILTSASNNLTKSYHVDKPSRQIIRTNCSAGLLFDVSEKSFTTFTEFAAILRSLVDQPRSAIIRGKQREGLSPTKVQRTIVNFPECPRSWLLIDLDEPILRQGPDGAIDARNLMPEPFRNVSCAWLRTGSYGVKAKDDPDDRDPWARKIRLGFVLSHPLTAHQIKSWFKDIPVDKAIYTPNQLNYTSSPIFVGMVDPVAHAKEERFGIIEEMMDEVQVPPDVYGLQPVERGTNVTTLKPLDNTVRIKLLEDHAELDAAIGERHGTVLYWAYNAFAAGMPADEVAKKASAALINLGREAREANSEAKNILKGAQAALAAGTLYLSPRYGENAAASFRNLALPPGSDPNPAKPGPTPTTPAIPATQWWDEYKFKNGAIKPILHNACIMLLGHSAFQSTTGKGARLAFDTFLNVTVWTEAPPWWAKIPLAVRPEIGPWGSPVTDDDVIELSSWWSGLTVAMGDENIPCDCTKEVLMDAMKIASKIKSCNVAQEYLKRCHANWDGIKRLDGLLERVIPFTTTDPNMLRSWGPKWMMQGVARVMNPGARADSTLILQGAQGVGKSTFFAELVPDKKWLVQVREVAGREASVKLGGRMICELAELSTKSSEEETWKDFLTRTMDQYRELYAHKVADHLRTCIFGGTTNNQNSINDPGGRRWWVVDCATESDVTTHGEASMIDNAYITENRDHLWAEAYQRQHIDKEQYWADKEGEAKARTIAADHSTSAGEVDGLVIWLRKSAENGGPVHPDVIRPLEIWTRCKGNLENSFTPFAGRSIRALMCSNPREGFEFRQINTRSDQSDKRKRIKVGVWIRRGSQIDRENKVAQYLAATHYNIHEDENDEDDNLLS